MFQPLDTSRVWQKSALGLQRGERFVTTAGNDQRTEGVVLVNDSDILVVLVTEGPGQFSVVSLGAFGRAEVLAEDSSEDHPMVYDYELSMFAPLKPGTMVIAGDTFGVIAAFAEDPQRRVLFVDLKSHVATFKLESIARAARLTRWSLYDRPKDEGGALLFEFRPN